LVEPVFVNKRSSGVRFTNFIQTFKFSNAHEGNITCLAPIKRGIFVTGGTDGYLKFWEPLEYVPLATLDESDSRAPVDFIIPVVG
jgi:WD40 repeat protein